MFRNGNDVIEWVNQQLRFGIKPGLERMEKDQQLRIFVRYYRMQGIL